jgi:hypothetical protein
LPHHPSPTIAALIMCCDLFQWDRLEWHLLKLKPYVVKPPFALSLSKGNAGLSAPRDGTRTDSPAFTLRQAQGERSSAQAQANDRTRMLTMMSSSEWTAGK